MAVLANEITNLTNEPFYVEIDEHLQPHVSTKELKFTNNEVA
jgi:hypothetical protein